VQVDGTDTITLTGSALAEITQINVDNMFVLEIEGLDNCTSLTYLYCANNSLTELPALPASLTYLDCPLNSITVLPTLPSSLTELYCGTNSITVLPTLPSSLTALDCYENSLTELPALPASLTYLDCSTNSITELPALPDGLIDFYCFNNLLTSAEMDAITIELDTAGLSGGFYDWNPQTNLQEPNQSAQPYLNLIAKSWTFG
jgi:Leucine-rich repeat (LRR) protein